MELKPHFLIPAWLEVQTGWAEIQWGVGDWGGGCKAKSVSSAVGEGVAGNVLSLEEFQPFQFVHLLLLV